MLAGGLIVAGVAIGVTLLVLTMRGFLETDATIEVDGQAHSVTVPTDGDRMLWFDERSIDPTCTIVDERDRRRDRAWRIRMRATPAASALSATSTARSTFDPGSGRPAR